MAVHRGHFQNAGPFEVPGFSPREVYRYFPEGDSPDQERPVLIVFDGQNAFGDFPGKPGWHLHSALDSMPSDSVGAGGLGLGAGGTRGLVAGLRPRVLAIPHGDRRADELTPFITDGWGGQADRFLDWIFGFLLPWYRREHRTPEGAAGVVLGGASWGGLLSLYGHFRHPSEVGGALCLSPSFWVGRGRAFELVERSPLPPISRLYLDCGGVEDHGQMIANAQRAVDTLHARGYGEAPERRLAWVRDERADHLETEWRKRLPAAVRWMFGAG